jgi:AcrR family transcriptional regulator
MPQSQTHPRPTTTGPAPPAQSAGAPAPARPLRADAQRNRARVLEAARAAFAAEGLAVPLDEIARRAGVGAGTVYRHFPTKEALFEAVVAARMQVLIEDAQARLAEPGPGPAFFAFFSTLVSDAAEKMDLADALAASGVGFQPETLTVGARLQEALHELLVRAQAAQAVRSDLTAADLHALVLGAVAAERRNAESARPTAPGRLTRMICDGLVFREQT